MRLERACRRALAYVLAPLSARRARRLMLAGSVVALLFLCAIGGLASGDTSSPSDDSATPTVLGDPEIQAEARRSVEEAAQQQASRDTASAQADREASRDAYTDLSASEALQADKRELPDLLNAPAATPFAPGPGAQVEQYRDDGTSALVKTADDDTVLAESELPLRGSTATGDTAPIDITLQGDGDRFAPESAAVRASLPAQLTDGISLPTDGGAVILRPDSANVDAVRADDDKLLYANALKDTDVLANALPTGAEFSDVVRSADAPETFGYTVDLPAGAELRATADGLGAEIVDGDRTLAVVPPPTAVAADGQALTVDLAVAGNRLELTVRHRGRDVAYPLAIDPTILPPETFDWHNAPGTDFYGWSYAFVPGPASLPHASGLTGVMATANTSATPYGAGLFVKTNGGNLFNQDDGIFRFTAPGDAYVYRADFNLANWNYTTTGGLMCTNAGIFSVARNTADSSFYVNCNNYTNFSTGLCVAGTYPNCDTTAGTGGNDAETNFWAWGDGQRPQWSITGLYTGTGAFSYASPVTVYLNDRVKPTVSWSGAQSAGQWTDSSGAVTAKDTGLGVKTVNVSSSTATGWAGASLPTTDACNGTRGDRAAGRCGDKTVGFSTAALPEGAQTIHATATDAVGNAATPLDYGLKIDHTQPNSLSVAGGTLTGSDNQPLNGSYTLNFAASDTFSGVKQVKFYVDDMTTPIDTRTQSTACGTMGCPGSLSGQFSLDTNAQNADGLYKYAEGTHTIKVAAEDPIASASGPAANHTTSKTFNVIVDRTAPSPDTSGALSDAEDLARLAKEPADLSVTAADENEAETQTSGVKSLEVKVDGTTVIPRVDQTCATPGCSMDRDFTINTASLAQGTHTADVLATDFAGNVDDQAWSFTIDRTSPLPFCSDPDADSENCQPDPPSAAAATCLPDAVGTTPASGEFLTAGDALTRTQGQTPDLLATSNTATDDGLTLAPALTKSSAGFSATGVAQASLLGDSRATFTVGSGADSTCFAPATTETGAPAPQLTSDGASTTTTGAAVEYADTAPATDTVLRPTTNGVQQFEQIRGAAAPETATYYVSLQPGQTLRKLDSGAVAVIDANEPAFSSSLPTYSPAATTPDTDPSAPPDTEPADDTATDAPDPTTLDGITPDTQTIKPAETAFQYDDQATTASVADDESDGQQVALITAPVATDAAGASVPTDLSIVGTHGVAVTTHFQSAGVTYPVTTATETLRKKRHTHPHTIRSLSVQHADELTLQNSAGEGVPKFIAAQNISWTRYILSVDACDHWTKSSGYNLDTGLPPSSTYDPNDPSERQLNLDDVACHRAVDFVHKATQLHLRPYITFAAGVPNESPVAYANKAARLWRSAPFKDNVTVWGATNEPDAGGSYGADSKANPPRTAHPGRAAQVWSELQMRRHDTPWCKGCQLIAGEFSRDNSDDDGFVTSYMNYFDGRKHKPNYWSLHDYDDIYQAPGTVSPRKYTYANLQLFRKNLNARFHRKRPIYVTEAGVLLHHSKGSTRLKDHPDLQVHAAKLFRELKNRRQVRLLSYYSVFSEETAPSGDKANTYFDSAIVYPPYYKQTLGDQNPTSLNGRTFRPVYCELAQRPTSVCDETTGH